MVSCQDDDLRQFVCILLLQEWQDFEQLTFLLIRVESDVMHDWCF